MVRPLRIEFPGAVYHITSRGNARKDIFLSDRDRRNFIHLLGQTCKRFNWNCFAYCLMSNHYHLVIETVEGNLSKGMRHLNGVYCQRFNKHHQRVGHVIQGRYTGILVDKDNYLLELVRYVLLNPVRANMVKTAGQWPWSSYRSMIGKTTFEGWLVVNRILSLFDQNKRRSRKRFIEFVSEGKLKHDIWKDLQKRIYLGDKAFVERIEEKIDENKESVEILRCQSARLVLSLEKYEALGESRNHTIKLAYESGGYSQKVLADYFGLHYSTISKILKGLN